MSDPSPQPAGAEPSDPAATVAAMRAATARAHRRMFGDGGCDDGSLAAVGITATLWRNSVLEKLHAGTDEAAYDAVRARTGWAPVGPATGIPDDVMLRVNVSTFRQLRAVVVSRGLDPAALGRCLCDGQRLMTGGTVTVTFEQLFAPVFDELVWDAEGCLWDQAGRFETMFELAGQQMVWQAAELFATTFAPHWFGTPWWRLAVDAAAAAGELPGALDAAALRYRPDRLDTPGARWLAGNRSFRLRCENARDGWLRSVTGQDARLDRHPWVSGVC